MNLFKPKWKGYPVARGSFITLLFLAYAYNSSRGRKVIRENSISVHFPKCGKYKKLFWRFYIKTSFKGYNQ